MSASTNYLEWNYAQNHVQAELTNGEYVSAESTLILAGPSRLEHIVTTGSAPRTSEEIKSSLYPIGIVQNFMMAQNRFLTRLFEIGSKRAYLIPGKLAANFQLNRIKFYGPSLLRMAYALAPVRTGFGGKSLKFVREGQPGVQDAALVTPPKYAALFPDKYLMTPGYGGNDGEDNRDFFINLASDLFQIPFGLAVIFKDAKNRPYGSFYLQDCMFEAHSLGVDANNVVLAEGANGQFDYAAPVQLLAGARTAIAA